MHAVDVVLEALASSGLLVQTERRSAGLCAGTRPRPLIDRGAARHGAPGRRRQFPEPDALPVSAPIADVEARIGAAVSAALASISVRDLAAAEPGRDNEPSLRSVTTRAPQRNDPPLVAECRDRAVALLKANLGPAASSRRRRRRSRGRAVTRRSSPATRRCVRSAWRCAPDALLEREAATAFLTLARHQAPNGQIPKFVDLHKKEVDFWYLGCIDATLWWLLGDSRFSITFVLPAGCESPCRRRSQEPSQWSQCQEHQRFHLLQQNEASDWADIMPRSGFVLYTNALWHLVKRLYGLPHAGRDAPQCQRAVPPVLAAACQVPARPAAHRLRAARRPQSRPLPQLRQFFVLRRRRRCLRKRIGDPVRARRRRGRAADARRAVAGTRARAVAGARRLRADSRGEHVLASVHVAPSAEFRVAIPQRRHLAVRRRILGGRAGGARRACRAPGASSPRSRASTRSTTGLSPSGCMDRTAAPAGHARAVVERGGLPDGASCGACATRLFAGLADTRISRDALRSRARIVAPCLPRHGRDRAAAAKPSRPRGNSRARPWSPLRMGRHSRRSVDATVGRRIASDHVAPPILRCSIAMSDANTP